MQKVVLDVKMFARNLLGKVAIVTASTDGIGYAIAERLLKGGAQVIVSSRKEENVAKAVESLKHHGDCHGLVCHVGKAADRTKLVEKARQLGGLNILVPNAAANPTFGPMLETSVEAFDKIFDINVRSTFLLIKEAVPLMEETAGRQENAGGASIVLVSSIGGFKPFEMIGAYSLSKTCLLGLTKCLTNELARKSIRINSLCPGVVKTKFSSALWKNPAVADLVRAEIPLHRVAEPHECAGLAAYLASDEASYVTGENFVIAGGMASRL